MGTSEEALKALIKARIPVMLVGAPGTAKTATIKALAAETGYDLITLVPSRMDAQDLSGFPTRGEYTTTTDGVDTVHAITEYAPQYWQRDILQKKRVILFLDEFGNAHPSVRASLLSFIQDRQFANGEFFPKETIIVGAMNPTDSGADGYELDKATTNRMTMISWKPDNQSWLVGMSDNWGRGVKSEEEQKWRNLIIRFLSDEPGYIHRENDTDVGTGESYGVNISDSSDRTILQHAWASRRSWDNLSMALPETGGNPYIEDIVMQGTVGASAATGFRAWLAKHGSLNVTKILAAPRKFKDWNSLSMDDMNIILSSSIDGVNKETIKQTIDIFRIVAEIGKESFAAAHLKRFANCHHNVTDITVEQRKEIRSEMFEVAGLYRNISNSAQRVSNRVPSRV